MTVAALKHVSIRRVVLQVADLDRSVAFYRDILGFAVRDREAGVQHVARLGPRHSDDVLLELMEKPGARPVPRGGLLGLYHFAVLLPERADLGRFIVHAANTGVRLAAADHLFSEALYLTDPDGLQVEVYCDRPRSAWLYRNGELAADTLPLDFTPVVAAAERTTWDGLPSRTTIGHVHFYIGDVAAARAFYVDGLGFAPTIASFPGALFVAADGYHHHVGLNTWAAGAPVATDDDARLLRWEFEAGADGVNSMAGRLRAAGLAFTQDAGSLAVVDPWGIAARITRRD